jgi:beta-mannosidase
MPADMMIGSVTAARHRALVRKAQQANMTMLRVWGGGIYEPDAFYSACGENGILVWQNFMFPCTDYPNDDPTLRTEVTAEARCQGPPVAQSPRGGHVMRKQRSPCHPSGRLG